MAAIAIRKSLYVFKDLCIFQEKTASFGGPDENKVSHVSTTMRFFMAETFLLTALFLRGKFSALEREVGCECGMV